MSTANNITPDLHDAMFILALTNKELSIDDIESRRANVLQNINAINLAKKRVADEQQKYIMGRNNFVQNCNPYHYTQRYHPSIFNPTTELLDEFGHKHTRPIPINR